MMSSISYSPARFLRLNNMKLREQNIPEKIKNREMKFFGQGELLDGDDLKFGCGGDMLLNRRVPRGKKWDVIVNIAVVESNV